MNLPNADHAYLDIRKLTEYILDPTDPRGRHKARVFRSSLCITVADAEVLRSIILAAVIDAECQPGEEDIYGQRYMVDCKIEFGGRRAVVRTGWIVKTSEDFPRFTTCFVL